MNAPQWRRTESQTVRELKRSAARTGYISGLVIFALLGFGNVLLMVSDLRHGRDITGVLFSLFMLLVATGLAVSRRRHFLGRQNGDRSDGPDGRSDEGPTSRR